MKKLDTSLLGARNDDLRAKISEANYLEELENKGLGPEDIISEVKNTLNIGENGSVIAEFQEKTAELNRLQKCFVDVNGLTNRLQSDNLALDGELEVLRNLEARLAEKVAGVYGLELSDLYGEENE
jgi:hypothetical protein